MNLAKSEDDNYELCCSDLQVTTGFNVCLLFMSQHQPEQVIMVCLLCLMQGVQVFDMSSRSRITSISKDHKWVQEKIFFIFSLIPLRPWHSLHVCKKGLALASYMISMQDITNWIQGDLNVLISTYLGGRSLISWLFLSFTRQTWNNKHTVYIRSYMSSHLISTFIKTSWGNVIKGVWRKLIIK